MVYKFRVLLDIEEDVFRDIEILQNQTFKDLHEAIIKAFKFRGDQMASFYISNDQWDKGEEIPLMEMDVDMDNQSQASMRTAVFSDYVKKPDQKLLYVYDFLRMWIFYIELIETTQQEENTVYPQMALSFGETPDEDSKSMDFMMDIEVDEDAMDLESEDEYGYDESDFDNLDDFEEYQ